MAAGARTPRAENARNERGVPSVADLKFVLSRRQALRGTSNPKPHQNCPIASVPSIPKFATRRAARIDELRDGDTSARRAATAALNQPGGERAGLWQRAPPMAIGGKWRHFCHRRFPGGRLQAVGNDPPHQGGVLRRFGLINRRDRRQAPFDTLTLACPERLKVHNARETGAGAQQ